MALMRAQQSYSRLDKEDPEAMKHLKARFLIHKVLEEADPQHRRSSNSRFRICRLKKKFGIRMKRLRVAISRARLCICRQVMKQFRQLKLV